MGVQRERRDTEGIKRGKTAEAAPTRPQGRRKHPPAHSCGHRRGAKRWERRRHSAPNGPEPRVSGYTATHTCDTLYGGRKNGAGGRHAAENPGNTRTTELGGNLLQMKAGKDCAYFAAFIFFERFFVAFLFVCVLSGACIQHAAAPSP